MRQTAITLGLIFSFILLTSCTRGRVRKEITIGSESLQVMMPSGKEIVHPEHGTEEWFAIGAMSGENGARANGVAQSHVFSDGTTIATVNLNIQEPRPGFQYTAWLQKPGSTERVRLDHLQNPLNDVRHVITTEIEKDLRGYTEVVVTLERSMGPSEDDAVQAVGTLKVQQR